MKIFITFTLLILSFTIHVALSEFKPSCTVTLGECFNIYDTKCLETFIKVETTERNSWCCIKFEDNENIGTSRVDFITSGDSTYENNNSSVSSKEINAAQLVNNLNDSISNFSNENANENESLDKVEGRSFSENQNNNNNNNNDEIIRENLTAIANDDNAEFSDEDAIVYKNEIDSENTNDVPPPLYIDYKNLENDQKEDDISSELNVTKKNDENVTQSENVTSLFSIEKIDTSTSKKNVDEIRENYSTVVDSNSSSSFNDASTTTTESLTLSTTVSKSTTQKSGIKRPKSKMNFKSSQKQKSEISKEPSSIKSENVNTFKNRKLSQKPSRPTGKLSDWRKKSKGSEINATSTTTTSLFLNTLTSNSIAIATDSLAASYSTSIFNNIQSDETPPSTVNYDDSTLITVNRSSQEAIINDNENYFTATNSKTEIDENITKETILEADNSFSQSSNGNFTSKDNSLEAQETIENDALLKNSTDDEGKSKSSRRQPNFLMTKQEQSNETNNEVHDDSLKFEYNSDIGANEVENESNGHENVKIMEKINDVRQQNDNNEFSIQHHDNGNDEGSSESLKLGHIVEHKNNDDDDDHDEDETHRISKHEQGKKQRAEVSISGDFNPRKRSKDGDLSSLEISDKNRRKEGKSHLIQVAENNKMLDIL